MLHAKGKANGNYKVKVDTVGSCSYGTTTFWPIAIRHMVLFNNSSIRRDKMKSPFKLIIGQSPT
jgi:hypothetical protein